MKPQMVIHYLSLTSVAAVVIGVAVLCVAGAFYLFGEWGWIVVVGASWFLWSWYRWHRKTVGQRNQLEWRETDPFESKIRQALKLKWEKWAEVTKDGEDAPFTKRSVRFIRGKEGAVLRHKDATITLVRPDLPVDFDDFIELEEFIAKHPREADLDDATGELRYLREMELFFVMHGYRDDIMHISPHSPDNALSFAAACAIQI